MQLSPIHFLKQNRIIIVLGAVACVFYCIILYQLGSFDYIKNTLYSTSDSLEYKGYAEWLSGKIDYCDPFRTFFYPLIILISQKLLGSYGIWFFQFLFWLIGCLLVFKTMLRLTGIKWLAISSFVIVVSNVSLIVYTAHALTEVSTFFFLSLFVYVLSAVYKDNKRTALFYGLLFIVSALTTIKPLYQLVWYAAIIIIFIINYRSVIRIPVVVLLLIVASSPVITQAAINKVKHDTFSSSKVADYNLQYYFYKKVNYYETTNNRNNYDDLSAGKHDSLNKEVAKISKKEAVTYLFAHPVSMLKVYWNNIDQNLRSGNPYITNEGLKWTAYFYNKLIYYIDLLMTFLWIFYLMKRFPKRNNEYYFILVSGLMTFYIIYSCGITYWAGDRLTVSATAVWGVFYPFLVYLLFIKKAEVRTQ